MSVQKCDGSLEMTLKSWILLDFLRMSENPWRLFKVPNDSDWILTFTLFGCVAYILIEALHSHSNLRAVENVWAPPDHKDFELVLKGFAILIGHGNVWAVDILEHLEQLPTLKDFQLDSYNQEEEEDYLTNNQDKEMIVCLGSELENLQTLLVDQDDEYYMSGCKWS
ncbi:hypothetical protein L218DRAFT_949895 [Marasmius fiardii PR-910]|nr:hypothetical protein L218DRAFT_949895 [Marasmius fiardii PR-910]